MGLGVKEEVQRVEEGVEIYTKIKNRIDLKKFKQVYKEDGLDPLVNLNGVKLDANIEDIISKSFKV